MSRYEKATYSLRDISYDVKTHFDLDKAPSPATIKLDKEWLAEQATPSGPTEEDMQLLDPQYFPQWRELNFQAPQGGKMMTPIHQLALFNVIISLALKRPLPEWVVEYIREYTLTEGLVEDANSLDKMLVIIFLMAPRHGKTLLVLHALIWLICYNPNIRIIYMQGVLTTSKKVMRLVKWELAQNQNLIDRYGPFKGEEHSWNTEEFTVANRTIPQVAPTFNPVGIGSNIRSLDADIIIVDDPQDIRRVTSETTAQNDYDFMTTELFTRREKHTPIICVGSHIPIPWGDLFFQLEESAEELTTTGQAIHIVKIPAHDVQTCAGPPHVDCVLWPEMRPWDFLEAQRVVLDKRNAGMFDAVYNQLPREGMNTYFDPEVMRGFYVQPTRKDDRSEYGSPILPANRTAFGILDTERSWNEMPSCCGPVVMVGGFDPAAGESRSASESVWIQRAACTRCGRRYVVALWHKKQSPERHPDTLGSFFRAWKGQLLRARIEQNAYQKALARDPRLRTHARENQVLIDAWMTDDRKNDFDIGVANMASWANDGLLSIPYKTIADQEKAEAYIAAYVRYPRKPTDIVMADWLAEGVLRLVLEDNTRNIPEMMPGSEHLSEYLTDQVYEVDMANVYDRDLEPVIGISQ